MRSSLSITLVLSSFVYSVALTGIRNHWSDPYSLRPNPLYLYYARPPAIRSPTNSSTSATRFSKGLNISPSRTWSSKFRAGALQRRQDSEPSSTTERDLDTRPTPEPTGEPSTETTIFITGENDFALLLPATPGGMFEFVLVTGVPPRSNPSFIIELVSDAESNAKAFCTPGSSGYPCMNKMPDGFVTAAALASANDNSWIQVTFASAPAGGAYLDFSTFLYRSLVVSIRQSFTWIPATLVGSLTCASRTGPSVPSAGEGQVLLSCALSLKFFF